MTTAALGRLTVPWRALSPAEQLVGAIACIWPFRLFLAALLPVDLHIGAVSFTVLAIYAVVTVRRLPQGFPTDLDLGVLAFAAVAVLDLALLGDSGSRALKGFTFEARFVVFYFTARTLSLSVSLGRWLLGAAIVLGVAAAVVGVVEYHLDWGYLLRSLGGGWDRRRFFKEGIPRLYSFAMVPLSAAYLMVLASAAIAAASRAKGRWWILALAIVWQALPLTLSRSAVAVTLALTGVYAVLGGAPGRRFAAVSVLAVAAGMGVLALRGWDRPLAQHAVQGATLSDDSASEHGKALWKGIALVANRPLGHGLGEAGYVARERQGRFRRNETHYLTVAVQMGIPGLVAFLSVVALAGNVWFAALRSSDPALLALAVAGVGLWAALALGGFLHATWSMIVPQLWFWLLTAIAVNHSAAAKKGKATP